MKLEGLRIERFDEVVPGAYRLTGHVIAVSEREMNLIAEAQRADDMQGEVNIHPDDFPDFLVVRYNLLELRKRYGDPCFFVQRFHSSPQVAGTEVLLYDEVMQGRLASQPHVPVRTAFGFDPQGGFDKAPGRRVELVGAQFEVADELVGAMFSERFGFLAVALFSAAPADLREVAARLESAHELDAFRTCLLALFPTAMRFDEENDFVLLTTDEALALELSATADVGGPGRARPGAGK